MKSYIKMESYIAQFDPKNHAMGSHSALVHFNMTFDLCILWRKWAHLCLSVGGSIFDGCKNLILLLIATIPTICLVKNLQEYGNPGTLGKSVTRGL